MFFKRNKNKNLNIPSSSNSTKGEEELLNLRAKATDTSKELVNLRIKIANLEVKLEGSLAKNDKYGYMATKSEMDVAKRRAVSLYGFYDKLMKKISSLELSIDAQKQHKEYKELDSVVVDVEQYESDLTEDSISGQSIDEEYSRIMNSTVGDVADDFSFEQARAEYLLNKEDASTSKDSQKVKDGRL